MRIRRRIAAQIAQWFLGFYSRMHCRVNTFEVGNVGLIGMGDLLLNIQLTVYLQGKVLGLRSEESLDMTFHCNLKTAIIPYFTPIGRLWGNIASFGKLKDMMFHRRWTSNSGNISNSYRL